MDMSQYLEIFIDESKEHLQGMNDVLLELENDYSNINLLNEIFRTAHTIKGMASTMSFNKVADLTHEMENVLHICRSGELDVDETIIDIIFECFDGLEEYVDNLANTGEEGDRDTSDLVRRLKYIADNKTTAGLAESGANTEVPAQQETVAELDDEEQEFKLNFSDVTPEMIAEAKSKGFLAQLIRVSLADDCILKAARSFIVFNTLENFGEIINCLPSAEDIEEENFDKSFEVLFLSKVDDKMIKEELEAVSEVEKVEIKTMNFNNIHIPVQTQEQAQPKPAPKVKQAKKTKANSKASSSKKEERNKASKTVRVDIDRLDNLMNLVSELIIIKTRLDDSDTHTSSQNMNETIEYLERITTSLHDAVMKVRMVPVERTFNRFPRMVRDLAKDLNKAIKLEMSGEDTEVDRTVIDEIGDPLIHLIRNSIDHGIENKEDRALAAKPDMGHVYLRAYPDGNSVVIEVEDDGHGIDPNKIAEKALSKNLVTEEQLESMNNTEIINMLFLPGFSTAEVITDLSGRGVGLDVVKTKIEALSGTVDVTSELGKGSKFTIRLPLTLAIIQALMVNLGTEKYAIPLNTIRIITTINADDISLVQGQEMVLYRNQTLPLIRLPQMLGITKAEHEAKNLTVVIVKKGNQEAGLVVDGLIGQQEIVIKSLGKYLGGVKMIAGATILGNGGVALIVDPNQLF